MQNKKKKNGKAIIYIVIVIVLAVLVCGIVDYCFMGSKTITKVTEKIKENVLPNVNETKDEQELIEETTEEIVKLYPEEPEEDVNVTLDAAKVIALADAECDAKDVDFINTETKEENGFSSWILSFKSKDKTYEYVISTYDGRIIDKRAE